MICRPSKPANLEGQVLWHPKRHLVLHWIFGRAHHCIGLVVLTCRKICLLLFRLQNFSWFNSSIFRIIVVVSRIVPGYVLSVALDHFSFYQGIQHSARYQIRPSLWGFIHFQVEQLSGGGPQPARGPTILS